MEISVILIKSLYKYSWFKVDAKFQRYKKIQSWDIALKYPHIKNVVLIIIGLIFFFFKKEVWKKCPQARKGEAAQIRAGEKIKNNIHLRSFIL